MSSTFKKIMNDCEYLQAYTEKDRIRKIHDKFLLLLKNIKLEELPLEKRLKLSAKKIEKPEDFFVEAGEEIEEGKCIALRQLLQIVLDLEKDEIPAANTLRDFWSRCYNTYRGNSHTDVVKVLNPLCRLLGYTDFKNFLDKVFKPDVYKILILSNSIDTEKHRNTEYTMQSRLAEIAPEKSHTLHFKCVDVYSICSSNTIMMQLRADADIIITGDVVNNKTGDRPFYLLNNGQSFFRTNYKRTEFIPFNFVEVGRGYLPLNIDYIIYWCLGMHAYQNNNVISALIYIDNIITKLRFENDQLYFLMGFLYHLDNNKVMALECYRKAVYINSQHVNSWLNWGIICLLTQDYMTAENNLRHYFELANNVRNICYYTGRLQLGILYKTLGRPKFARNRFIEVIEDLQENHFSHDTGAMQVGNEILARTNMELAELYISLPEYLEANTGSVKMHLHEAMRLSVSIKTHNEIKKYLTATEIAHALPFIKKTHSFNQGLIELYSDKHIGNII